MIMVLAIGCDMILLHYIHREIHRPLDHLMQTIQEIEDGDYKQRAEEDYHTEELQRLTQAFNRMMNVIVNLRIRAYDEKIQLMDTQMKYFQMQLKPHFFLNALTTIYSMSYQKRNEDIRTYIDALTKTVRYMFKGGLRLVLLKEETQHLENYFEMQQLRYPDCVFWYFDMEEAAMSWKIPQMLLHTFVENEYKYAVKIDSVLSILIQAKVLLKEGEEMLYIRMEDDGVGFPEQVMQYMNFESEDPSREGHHVGLWNIKRTMEVLYQKRELIHLSNLETGGCLIEIWIPKTTAVGEEQEIKMNVLIVDDDMATVDVICKSVNWSALHIDKVMTAYNIEKAKEVLADIPADIVVCDIEMPMGNGTELLKWVRENDMSSEFLFLTCHTEFQYASVAIRYQAAGYLVKPFRVEQVEAELLRLVQRIMEKRKIEEESHYGNG